MTAAVLIGVGAGLLITIVTNGPRSRAGSSPESAEATRSPSVPVAAVPEPVIADPAEVLRAAQDNVHVLELQLAGKEAELARVAEAAGVPADQLATTDLAAEVGTARANLEAARKVRDRLKSDLKVALAEVETQSQAASHARSVAKGWKETNTRSRWEPFEAQAKVELCDHGTRRAIDTCQRSVGAYFTDARFDRYADCIEGGGADPVPLAAPHGDSVPAMAEPIGAPARLFQREDWFVLYCDPNLPEADQRVAGAE